MILGFPPALVVSLAATSMLRRLAPHADTLWMPAFAVLLGCGLALILMLPARALSGFIDDELSVVDRHDKAMLRKKKSLVSVPFNKITSVSSVDEGRGIFGSTSELIVKTGSQEFEFEFRDGDKPSVHTAS
jgi:hypothetical protein